MPPSHLRSDSSRAIKERAFTFSVFREERRLATENLVFPRLDVPYLLFVQVKLQQLHPVATIVADGGQQAGRCALRGGCRIIELVRKVAGQLPQSRKLFGLLLDAGHFAYAVEQRRNHPLCHGGNGRHHLRKKRAVNKQEPYRRHGESLAAVAFHPREGKHSGHLSGTANEECHRATMLAAHMDLALENEYHVLRRCSLFKQNVAGVGSHLSAVMRKPEAFFESKAIHRANVIDGLLQSLPADSE